MSKYFVKDLRQVVLNAKKRKKAKKNQQNLTFRNELEKRRKDTESKLIFIYLFIFIFHLLYPFLSWFPLVGESLRGNTHPPPENFTSLGNGQHNNALNR